MSTSALEAYALTLTATYDILRVDLADGRTLEVPIAWFPRLLHATPEERGHYELIGRGEGIHWPDLEEDISVTSLLAGRRSQESAASLQRWLAARSRR